jgi:hypothetical protein
MSSAKGRYYEWYIDETELREQDWHKILLTFLLWSLELCGNISKQIY